MFNPLGQSGVYIMDAIDNIPLSQLVGTSSGETKIYYIPSTKSSL